MATTRSAGPALRSHPLLRTQVQVPGAFAGSGWLAGRTGVDRAVAPHTRVERWRASCAPRATVRASLAGSR